MNFYNSVKETSLPVFRTSPVIIIISTTVLYLTKPSLKTFEIVCAVTVSLMSVKVFKVLAEAIMKDKSFFMLGSGLRPKGAKNCGLFKNNKFSTSFGMPSGHVILAASFATSMGFYIMEHRNMTYNTKIGIIIALAVVTYSIQLSRITLGCHTVAQVVVGLLLGTGISSGIHYLFKFYDNEKSEPN